MRCTYLIRNTCLNRRKLEKNFHDTLKSAKFVKVFCCDCMVNAIENGVQMVQNAMDRLTLMNSLNLINFYTFMKYNMHN